MGDYIAKATLRAGISLTGLYGFFLCFSLFSSLAVSSQNFPLRENFPLVPIVTTEDLQKAVGKALIVDVRSTMEFNVIHIKGAKHVQLAKSDFPGKLAQTVNRDKDTYLIFYCNGHSCSKSYVATQTARNLGYSHVAAYDSGIFDWAQAHPEQTVLLGRSPIDPASIISSKDFESRLLDEKTFNKTCTGDNAFLIDIRDPIQRQGKPYLARKSHKVYMDQLIKQLAAPYFKAQVSDKTLCFFDAVGKQVKWLDYYLIQQHYSHYYFLKRGVRGSFSKDNHIHTRSSSL